MTNDHQHVEIAIIGAGTAGLSARQEVARHTESYVVIDPGPLGTTCARVACMPSKALIHVANVCHQISHLPPGLNTRKTPSVDLVEVMNHVRAMRDDFVAGVIQGMQDWQDSHLISKHARFLDPHTLDLEGKRLSADRIIIATGSRPVIPEPWQPFNEYLLDTNRFFELKQLPSSLAVIGLGPVGIELAQALQRLGIEVTGIDPVRGIGGLSDPDLQDYAIDVLSANMELCFAPAKIQDADASQVTITADEQTIQAKRALIAIGRRPNIQDLGLDNLDLRLNDQGLPDIDSTTLQVGDLPVFVAGDVNGIRPLLHEASDEGRIAGYNATRESPECFTRRTPLAITFTSPTIAIVGDTFQELKKQERDFVIGSVNFERQGRARIMHAAHGLLRIYADRHDGRLLGAELFAPDGEHLAHLLAWSISMQKTAPDLLEMPYYHPVLEEGLRSAIRDAAKQLDASTSYTQTMRCDDNPVI